MCSSANGYALFCAQIRSVDAHPCSKSPKGIHVNSRGFQPADQGQQRELSTLKRLNKEEPWDECSTLSGSRGYRHERIP